MNHNTTPPAPSDLIGRILSVGPLKCMARFLAKSKALAIQRGDHAAAMEMEVQSHFVTAENVLRHEAATDSRGIRDHVRAIIATADRIAADHVITQEEERELHAELGTLFARSRRHARNLTADKLLPL